MDRKKITIIAFIVTCLAQLFIPTQMILNQEEVLKTGTAYKFRTRPIDPYDPFRGKYITLNFADNIFIANTDEDATSFLPQERVFVEFNTDQHGFAHIASISLKRPVHPNYLETTVDYSNPIDSNKTETVIHFPFNRYYMEETKAQPAEEAYQLANQDSTAVVYALVHIKDGTAVLKDVVVNEKSIKAFPEEKK